MIFMQGFPIPVSYTHLWENALEMLFGRIEKTRLNQPVTIMIPAGIRIGDTA